MMQAAFALLILAGFIAATWAIVSIATPLTVNVLGQDSGRNATLDGMRGLLSIAVLLHHGFVIRHLAEGSAPLHLSQIENFLGRASVSFFFMASAFLFAGQIIRNRGRVNALTFFAGRVRRIVPLYLFAVTCAYVAVIWEAGFVIKNPGKFVHDAAEWLLFDFVKRSDLNGVAGSADYLGVVWSLRYEWLLFAILPILAALYRRTGYVFVIYAGLAIASIPIHLFSIFLAGAFAYPLARINFKYDNAIITIAAVIGIAIALKMLDEFVSSHAAPLLFPVFLLVVRGDTWLVKWLATTSMRYLGQVSYSLYLLHPLVLLLLAKHLSWLPIGSIQTNSGFLIFVTIAFLLVFAIASLTYILIERPFMLRSPKPVTAPSACVISTR